jgi:hypothetical protein
MNVWYPWKDGTAEAAHEEREPIGADGRRYWMDMVLPSVFSARLKTQAGHTYYYSAQSSHAKESLNQNYH